MNNSHHPIVSDLHLTSFCGFADFNVHLHPLTVLVGPNNGGKTTILRAVRFLTDCLDLVLPRYAQLVNSYFQKECELAAARDLALAEADETRKHVLDEASASSAPQDSPARAKQIHQVEQLFQQKVQAANAAYKSGMGQVTRPQSADSCPVKQVAQRQLVENLETFFHKHQATSVPTLVARVTTQPVACIVSVAITREKNGEHVARIAVKAESGPIETIDAESRSAVLSSLMLLRSEYVQPVSTLLPSEKAHSWPQVQATLNSGKPHEVWRNQFHWLSEGKTPEVFQRVIEQVRHAMPGVALNLPSRTRDQNPNVVVDFEDAGTSYDIAESGNGLRTLLSVASHLCLSDAPVLLLDEPDSHLHSAIQREMCEFITDATDASRQVILTTHAPDMIDAFPIESQLWIDRSQSHARKCDDATATLVELGALLPSEAMQSSGGTSLLYCEGKPDRKSLVSLFTLLGDTTWLDACTIATLRGFGDAAFVPGVLRFLREHHQAPYLGAVLLDSDYAYSEAPITFPSKDALIARLPCKELENLLLLCPDSILASLRQAADRRHAFTSRPVSLPTVAELGSMIVAISAEESIRESIIDHWMLSRLPPKPDASDLRTARQDFLTFWGVPENRLRYGPGKRMLSQLRVLLQQRCQVTLPSTASIFAHYSVPSEVSTLLVAIRDHLTPAGASLGNGTPSVSP